MRMTRATTLVLAGVIVAAYVVTFVVHRNLNVLPPYGSSSNMNPSVVFYDGDRALHTALYYVHYPLGKVDHRLTGTKHMRLPRALYRMCRQLYEP